MICEGAIVKGADIDIQDGALIHPRASLIADKTKKVVIGESTIIEELVTVHNSTIKHSNIIGVGSTVVGSTIGVGNIISPKVISLIYNIKP